MTKAYPNFGQVTFESLEPRLLLSGNIVATMNPNNGCLKVCGDGAANQVEITREGNALRVAGTLGTGTTINGTLFQVFNGVTALKVKLHKGDDTLVLRNVIGMDGRIILGRGADQLLMYNSAFVGEVQAEIQDHSPELNAIGAKVVNELALLTFTATATDIDDPASTYSLTGDVPDGAAIDLYTGVFTWTPTEAQGPGVYVFNVQASDGLLADFEAITVTVNEVG